MIIVLYGLDILVKLNTQVYKKGIILRKKKLIAIRYLETAFIYDALAFVPLILELTNVRYPFKFWNLFMYSKIATY